VKSLGVLLLLIALVTGLGAACGGGEPPEPPPVASDELRAQIVEAVSPEGKSFHAEMNVVSPGESAEAETVEVWIDEANNRARSESPDRFQGKPIVTVSVGAQSWSYDPWADRVDTQEIPAAEPAKMAVQSPAVLALDYVRELATADQWRIVDEESEGRLLVFETKRTLKEADEDHAAGTVLITRVELDTKTLLPVRHTSSGIKPDGKEWLGAIAEFPRTEYFSPDEVTPDLFSPESVYALVGPQ
jgi:outer membrane lipoprotein-sorting protein